LTLLFLLVSRPPGCHCSSDDASIVTQLSWNYPGTYREQREEFPLILHGSATDDEQSVRKTKGAKTHPPFCPLFQEGLCFDDI
jgi:hypothetical protein